MDRKAHGPHRTRADCRPGRSDDPFRRSVYRSRLLTLRNDSLGDAEAGWTFVEILIVISIILILTSAVGFMAFRYIDKARVVSAKTQIEALSLALNAYALDCNQYPTREQGLDALWVKPVLEPVPTGWEGPYVNKMVTDDPWGHPYELLVPGPNALPFGLKSFGADGKDGGDGNNSDIVSWQS
jgi:general secretion pathway protein G